MENIRNFVNGITGVNNAQLKNDGAKVKTIPRVDGNAMKQHIGPVEIPRNRTESESSSASMSSPSAHSQKDKSSDFWVM